MMGNEEILFTIVNFNKYLKKCNYYKKLVI